MLEWTFDWPSRPGVRIRRKVRLFDELGRIQEPKYAANSPRGDPRNQDHAPNHRRPRRNHRHLDPALLLTNPLAVKPTPDDHPSTRFSDVCEHRVP